MKTIKFGSFIFLMVLLSVGCNARPANAGPSPTPSPAVVETPVVSSDKGGFQVTLIYMQNGNPVRGQQIYLAEMIPVQGQLQGAYVPALDRTTAPSDESSDSGVVVISLVPAGKYALAVLTPRGSILIQDAKTSKEITFDIVAGQITDLGRLEVSLDPTELEPLTK